MKYQNCRETSTMTDPNPPDGDELSKEANHQPRLYSDLATWFHLLTTPHDYREEADYYSALIVEAADGPVRTVLELGSGGGNNASHMKQRFSITLSDLSPDMLEVSRSGSIPSFTHIQGDMRTSADTRRAVRRGVRHTTPSCT